MSACRPISYGFWEKCGLSVNSDVAIGSQYRKIPDDTLSARPQQTQNSKGCNHGNTEE
ncbi:hypothetical protein [Nostoc sp. C052]|uniref:hypothetical protein n=1 Tax=Nostoc sp. C052 TaxID=2576902 RepID=UPI0015C2FDB0|nr:hypothetical protein [Nostoc sp. C052]